MLNSNDIVIAKIIVTKNNTVIGLSTMNYSILEGLVCDYGDGFIVRGRDITRIAHTYRPGTYIFRLYGTRLSFKFFSNSYLADGTILSDFTSGYIEYIKIHEKFFNMHSALPGHYLKLPEVKINNVFSGNNSIFIKCPDNYTGCISEGNENYCREASNEVYVENAWAGVFISGRFNPTGALNQLGPKLNGAIIGNFTTNAVNSYTYTSHPNKKIKEVLFNRGVFDNTHKWIRFDKENFKIIIENKDDGNSSRSVSIKIVYEDDTFDVDYFIANYRTFNPCLIEGTQITLYDGTKKNIEDLCYNDLLFVYNFYNGTIEAQLPYYIKKKDVSDKWLKINLEDGTWVGMVGEHSFYDARTRRFVDIKFSNYNEFVENETYFMKVVDGKLTPIKVVSFELINEEKAFYTLFTSGTQTYFANDCLSGIYDLNLIGEINENHILDTSKTVDIVMQMNAEITYEEFSKRYGFIEKGIFYGFRYDVFIGGLDMGMDAGKHTDTHNSIRDAVKLFWAERLDIPKIDNEEAYWICLMYKDGTIKKELYKFGTTINLDGTKIGWRDVTDGKIYNYTYDVRLNTVLKEI